MAEFQFEFDPYEYNPDGDGNPETPNGVTFKSLDALNEQLQEERQKAAQSVVAAIIESVVPKAEPAETDELPRLYTKGKLGELRYWEVAAVDDKVITVYGVVDGKAVRVERKAKPKNIGRANATTAEQQALKEAAADHKFMLDRKYSLTPDGAQETVPLPMLAKKFKDAKEIQYPVDVQRKYDGVRAMARWNGGQIELISRNGIPWERVQHLNKALEKVLPKGSEFDGEIYLHGKTLQQITQIVKNLKHPDNPNLTYQVYDMPTVCGNGSLPWFDRRYELRMTFIQSYPEVNDGPIGLTETFGGVENPEQVQSLHDRFVQEGYEGAIVRIPTGVYEYGYRSDFLLKVKEFDDTEFEIVDFMESEGEPGLVKWVCKNDTDDQTFETRPRGTHADRRWLLQHGQEFVGKKLTVVHFGRTDGGLPKFPIGKAIRVEEDLDG